MINETSGKASWYFIFEYQEAFLLWWCPKSYERWTKPTWWVHRTPPWKVWMEDPWIGNVQKLWNRTSCGNCLRVNTGFIQFEVGRFDKVNADCESAFMFIFRKKRRLDEQRKIKPWKNTGKIEAKGIKTSFQQHPRWSLPDLVGVLNWKVTGIIVLVLIVILIIILLLIAKRPLKGLFCAPSIGVAYRVRVWVTKILVHLRWSPSIYRKVIKSTTSIWKSPT